MAIRTILVGCDLSEGAEVALSRAAAIAQQHEATIVLVHAQGNDDPIPDTDNELLQQLGEVSAAVRVEEARKLADLLATVRAHGVTAEVVTRVGPPAEVLAAVATEREAELVAVGTHGRTGISRFLLGSVAAETIRHAVCDVLVCRGPVATTTFQRPLLATDFSPVASKALARAAEISTPDATIEVVHAWQLPAGSWGATLLGQARFPWSTVRDAVLQTATAQAAKLEAEAAAIGRPIHVALVQGPPASVITHTAESGGHDLIVTGAHGHRGFRRLLLGSVAENTTRHAPCSVLIVHNR